MLSTKILFKFKDTDKLKIKEWKNKPCKKEPDLYSGKYSKMLNERLREREREVLKQSTGFNYFQMLKYCLMYLVFKCGCFASWKKKMSGAFWEKMIIQKNFIKW